MCRRAVLGSASKPILKKSEPLKKEDEWIASADFEAFASDIRKLGEELEKNQGEADVKHLNKMIGWSNACAFLGLVTMGFGVNFFSIAMLSTWTFSRWTMIAHHTCHGGYDKCHPNKVRTKMKNQNRQDLIHITNIAASFLFYFLFLKLPFFRFFL
jgi:hypothetical protein